MTQTGQVGESAAQRPSILLDAPLPSLAHYSGLLGNQRAQVPTTSEFEEEELWLAWTGLHKRLEAVHLRLNEIDLKRWFGAALLSSKLALLKRHKFTAEGRELRIATSVAALESPQPIILTREQWKEVVEEIEDEDED